MRVAFKTWARIAAPFATSLLLLTTAQPCHAQLVTITKKLDVSAADLINQAGEITDKVRPMPDGPGINLLGIPEEATNNNFKGVVGQKPGNKPGPPEGVALNTQVEGLVAFLQEYGRLQVGQLQNRLTSTRSRIDKLQRELNKVKSDAERQDDLRSLAAAQAEAAATEENLKQLMLQDQYLRQQFLARLGGAEKPKAP